MESAIAPSDLDFLEQHLAHIKQDVEAIDRTIASLKQPRVAASPFSRQLHGKADERLLTLVGTQPAQPPQEEKRTIRGIIRRRFAR